MSKNLYRNSNQQRVVVEGVKALLAVQDKCGAHHISKESLKLIIEKYSNLVDPIDSPDSEPKY